MANVAAKNWNKNSLFVDETAPLTESCQLHSGKFETGFTAARCALACGNDGGRERERPVRS